MTGLREDIPEFVRDALGTDVSALGAAADGVSALALALSASSSEEAGGRARLLATLSAPSERYAPLYVKLSELFDLSAAALRGIFEQAANPAAWETGPLPGVSLFHFAGGPRVAHADTGLVRLKAGSVFPRHRHQAPERVLIVDGSYQDDSGRVFGPGDSHPMDAGSEHRLRVASESDALLAVVLEAEIVMLEAPE